MQQIYNTRVFILCAGLGERWNNYLGIPKQMIKFNGETLIDRTIRLIKPYSQSSKIFIVTENEKLKIDGTIQINPATSTNTIDSLLSTQSEWGEKNIFLLGDVFYSKATLKKIFVQANKLRFFGKIGVSKFGRCKHGEIFALKFSKTEMNFIVNCAGKFKERYQTGFGNFWDLYHTITELPYHSGITENAFFEPIWDFTDDFDFPNDYDLSFDIYSVLNSKNQVEKLLMLSRLYILNLSNRWQMRNFNGYGTTGEDFYDKIKT